MSIYGENMSLVEEKAKITFLPKFRERAEYKELIELIEETEKILKENDSKSIELKIYKVGKNILRITELFENCLSVAILPFCKTVLGSICYILSRLYVWCSKIDRETHFIDYTNSCIEKLEKCKRKIDDKEKIKHIDDTIKKLNKMKEKINNTKY